MHGPSAASCWPLKRDFLVPCVYHFYQRPPVLVRGEGAYLFDAEGRRYLDCFSGVSVVNAGHCNPEIVEAAVEQLRRLQHTTTIYLTEPMLELARAHRRADAGRPAAQLLLRQRQRGQRGGAAAGHAGHRPQRVRLPDGGLHGRTKWAMSVTGLDMWRTDPDPLLTAHAVPGPRIPDSLAVLERLLRRETHRGRHRRADPGQRRHRRAARRLLARAAPPLHPLRHAADRRRGADGLEPHRPLVRHAALGRHARHRHGGQGAGQRLPDRRLRHHATRSRPITPAPAPRRSAATSSPAAAALATLRFHQRHDLGRRSEALGEHLLRTAARAAASAIR